MAWSREKQREYMRGYYAKNKDVMLGRNQQWRTRNRDRHLALARDYHWKNRDRILEKKREYSRQTKEKRAVYLRKIKYGLSAEQYDAMLVAQNGMCAVCRLSPAVVVDHDHRTGVVRSILCSPCNTGIGLFQESLERLDAAIKYLSGQPK